MELLKQPQYRPIPLEQEVMVIYAGTQGFLDDVPVGRTQEFQAAFLNYVDTSAANLRSGLTEKKELTPELEGQLKSALNDFKSKVWKK